MLRTIIRKSLLSLLFLHLFMGQEVISVQEMLTQADSLRNAGRLAEAQNVFEQVLVIQESVLGDQHLDTAETRMVLGEISFQLGDLSLADHYLQTAVEIYEYHLTRSRIRLIKPLELLSDVYSLQGDLAKLKVTRSRLSEVSDQSMSWSADTSGAEGLLQDPEDGFIWDSLDTRLPDSSFLGKSADEAALELMELGYSYVDRGLYTEAAKTFVQALRLDTPNLDTEFYYTFMLPDEVYYRDLLDALYLERDQKEALPGNDFYLSLIYFQQQSMGSAIDHMLTYTKQRPADIRGFLFLADYHALLSEWLDALWFYQKAIWLDNQNAAAWFGEGKSLQRLHNFADAAAAYEKVIDLDPFHHEAYFQLGLSLVNLERFTEAIPNLTQSLLLDPDNARTYYYLGIAYLNSNRRTQALEALERAIRINPDFGEAHLELGRIYEEQEELERAVDHYQLAQEVNPELEEINYLLGMAYYRQEEYYRAMEPLREYVMIQPDSVLVLKALGDIFLKEKRYAEAIDTFGRLKYFEPGELSHYLNIAESYWHLDELENAYQAYRDVLLLDDENSEILYRLGLMANQLGEYPRAVEYLQTAIGCGDPDYDHFYQLAIAFGSQGRYMQALLALEKAQAFDRGNMEVLFYMGVSYMELDLPENAIQALNRYMQSQPRDPIAHKMMGKAYFRMGDFLRAMDHFQQSINASPDEYETHYYLGLCYRQTGRYMDAARKFKEALNLEPDDPKTHYALGQTYLNLEKMRSARKEMNILYMLDPVLYDSLRIQIENK